MTEYVLDSVIIIDHLNGVGAATRFLATNAGRVRITAITLAEVLAGYDPGADRDAAEALLSRFPLVVVDGVLANTAASLRRTHRWKLPDAIQAAVAISKAIRLATRNTKDFPSGEYAWVHVPYVLPSPEESVDVRLEPPDDA